MKIQVVNDLHMEFGHWPQIKKAGDVLCVAGDLCNWETRYEGLEWLQEQAAKFDKVFFVPGNHEHYGNTFYKVVREFWRHTLGALNHIHFPENGVEHDGVVFLGDTLWTDLKGGDPLAVLNYTGLMNDQRWINAHEYMEENRVQRLQLEKAVLDNIDKPIFMMTHHLPCYEVITPRWRGDALNPCFANAGRWAQDIIAKYGNVKVWHFGHTHDTIDQEMGGCRFVCNPYGYEGHAVNKQYNNAKIIKL